jgi:uncharacterized repeat protein (TIGR04076 family)
MHADAPPPPPADAFTLYDLRVEVVAGPLPMVCNHRVGDWFELSGENLRFPPGQTFPLYPLAAILPLLPAKQRPTHPNDWMTTDAEIACPDPHCGGRFRITRVGVSTFRHGEVTRVPLPGAQARHVPSFALTHDTRCPRLIRGAWQLAGGHGAIDREQAITDALAYAEAGITAFDGADIYTGVEALLGETRRRWAAAHPDAPPLRVHTKCVPDLAALPTLQARDIHALVDRSRERLGQAALDLVQFHWWDFTVPGFLDAVRALDACRRDGRVHALGLTNTDAAHVREVLAAGVPVVSNQVQVSLLDRRALREQAPLCAEHGMSLLCYGTLAGGFFHERWLGAPDPAPDFENRSLVKYRLIIEECGGWEPFQSLLGICARVAARHQASIGAVAVAWVLAQPAVGAAIVGARNAVHLAETVRSATLTLSARDLAELDAWLIAHPGPQGPVYALERDREGRHGRIMRYNLNRG